jgi:hypothetical protein
MRGKAITTVVRTTNRHVHRGHLLAQPVSPKARSAKKAAQKLPEKGPKAANGKASGKPPPHTAKKQVPDHSKTAASLAVKARPQVKAAAHAAKATGKSAENHTTR